MRSSRDAEKRDRKVSVAIFVPTLGGGGAERVMVTVANELVLRGEQVDVVLVEGEGPYRDELNPLIEVIDLKARRMFNAILPFARYLKRVRPEVVLSALRHCNVAALIAASLVPGQSRVVVSERQAVSHSAGGLVGGVVDALARLTYRKAQAVVAVSEGVRQDVVRAYGVSPERVRTIYNPLPLEHIASLARQECAHPWLVDPSQQVILAAGRLSPIKGYDMLLKAFAMLVRSRSAKLIILGDGPLRAELVRLTSDLGLGASVDFVGFEQNPYRWMARCDVFVLSSLSEGMPNALMQAMACGAQVVSTDCPHGPSELLEGGRWGELVRVGDVPGLAAALSRTLDRLGDVDVSVRAKEFSQAEIVGKYAEVLGLSPGARVAGEDSSRRGGYGQT